MALKPKASAQCAKPIKVLVVYSPAASQIWQQSVQLPEYATVADAIDASSFAAQHPKVDWQAGGVGILGQRVEPGAKLQDGDRVEIYRGLVFDPKESRRRRARHRQRQKQRGD